MKLFFRREGEGKPLVILHGLFGLSDNWMSFARMLASGFSVYVPDLRNHGRSAHSSVFDFYCMEDDLLEFLEDQHLPNIILMGHSLGGKISMNFALRHPGMVQKLIVVDISPRKYTSRKEHQNLIDAMQAVDFSVAKSRTDVDRQLSEHLADIKLRQFLMKNVYWRNRTVLDWRLNLKSINENLPAVSEGIDISGTYTGPALFIRGGLSSYIRDADVNGIKEKFPGAELVTIANASHWVQADAPGEFHEIVRKFLDK